jgi:hypothetical protein
MKPQDQSRFDYGRRTTDAGISRRAAVGSSGLAILGLLSGSVFGQEAQARSRKEATGMGLESGVHMPHVPDEGNRPVSLTDSEPSDYSTSTDGQGHE